jgi:hypothetical protein
MPDGSMADLVLVAHFAFMVFVARGGFPVWRWRRLAWVHIPVVLWGAAIAIVGFECPLTPLENRLQRLGGRAGYEGGFIEHYITAALALNFAVYWRAICGVPPRARTRRLRPR